MIQGWPRQIEDEAEVDRSAGASARLNGNLHLARAALLTRPLSPRPATQLSARKVERLVAEGEAEERHYAMLREQSDMAA